MNGGYELYLEGCELIDSGEYSKAVAKLLSSIAEMPHFKTYERLSECYSALGDIEKAFDCAYKAYSLNPRNDKTALRYAEMLTWYNYDVSRAREVLKEILARAPSYKPARVMWNALRGRN